MAMLMLYCIKHEQKAADVFEEVIFLQNIKSKSNKHQTVEIMKAEDFYRVLVEAGIR
jgi:riboflavin biosynthesis pyrimidine reductase